MADYQGENFRYFLKKNNISADKAASILNKNRVTVYQYFKSKSLSREVVSNILTSFNVREDEIWNGTIPKLEAIPLRLADPEGFEATTDKIYKLPDESLIMQVPIIPYKAYASYLRGHSDPEFYDGLETMPVPVDKSHWGTYLVFEVGGESMVNITTPEMARKSIWPREKVVGRDVKREHWKYKLHINSHEAFVIVHRTEGIVIKDIVAHDVENATITLHSWNPDKNEYPDYTVSLNDVEQIFNIVDPYNKFG